MKKYIKIGMIVLLFILILIIWIRNLPAPKHIRNMVLDNKNDYETIAKICYEDYQKHTMRKLVYLSEKNSGIYCIEYNYYIILNDSERVGYQNVYDNFNLDGKPLEYFCVYDTFVSFCIVNGRESIIYSVDDKRPSYIKGPGERKKKIAIRKIKKHWYYAYDNGWS